MIKIAHRGNYAGRVIKRENTPDYVQEAIDAGYNVMVDAWLLDREWYLGYMFPITVVDKEFFERPEIWVHAMNLVGYVSLYNNPKVHVFWHNKDDFAITSKGIKWANTGIITHDGVMFKPECSHISTTALQEHTVSPLGICSDDFELFSGNNT